MGCSDGGYTFAMTNHDTQVDAVALLREQHTAIRRLIADVQSSTADGRGEPFEALVRLLAVHETSEEEVVYPTARGTTESAADVVEARKREEDEAKKTLASLEGMETSSVEFLAAFVAFAEDVDEHATAEEETIFPLLEQHCDADERRQMGKALEAAQVLAPTHAHRIAPEGAVSNMLVGPFVAIVDRVRDAIRDSRR
jgi:hemerythrin superfamily protein